MKKRIFVKLLWVVVPCILILSAALIYLRYLYEAGITNKDIADYTTVAALIAVAIGLLFLVIANITAKKLTIDITNSLENIDLKRNRMTMYAELIPFAAKIDNQEQTIRARLEEISSRTNTIETITSNMQEGLILIDSDGTVLSANKSALRVFGENIENKNVIHIYRDDSFQSSVRKCIEGDSVEMQIENEKRIYSVFFSPVRSSGKTRGAVILFYDSTERHRAEKQRREFSANVSHELKTPLTTISAISEMIAQGIAKEDDIKVFASRITEQSGRLLLLIDDIIRLSEFDEGAIDNIKDENREAAVFCLRELAEAVIDSLRENTGNIEIELSGDRFDISANHRMIDELLYNLIDNGVKYNKENGKVTVCLTKDENNLCRISVSDTGIGIGNEHHQHIFERFYRVEKSRSKKTGGTGLGLSIVKHITEYYNGSVEIESTEGSGTTITCYLVL